jgi:hypothetical protein
MTAAATAATPPPTKISVQGTPAASRGRPAIARMPQGSASVTSGGKGSSGRCRQRGAANQPNFLR